MIDPHDVRIPLVEETLSTEKRTVETGRVNIRTFVDNEDVVLRDDLTHGIVEVDRVAIGHEIDVAPDMREEGDYLILPVVEERLVVEKRLFLVEELRIRRSTVSEPVELPVTRRVMRAVIERDDPVTHNPEEART